MTIRKELSRRARTNVVAIMTASMLAATAAQATTVNCGNIWQRTGSGWYESNPTYTDPRDDSADWIISTPGAEGMDKATLDEGVDEIRNRSLKSVLVLRNGKLVYERYFNGGSRQKAHNIHSASKTLLRLVVGVAVQHGYISSLDSKVSTILPEYFTNATTNKKNITIRHLLTMSAGLRWKEDNYEYSIDNGTDWVKGVLDQPMLKPSTLPGTVFEYSTGLTHVLSAVIQRTTGMNTCQFAHNQLLNTMNITAEHWGRDPKAVYSGGYNVYMTAREMAKLGQLMLNQGNWNGAQLVPSADINQIKTKVFSDGPQYGYGHLAWLRKADGHDVYIAWGHGGQFIYVIPSLNMVYVSTQGTTTEDGNADGYLEIDHETFVDDYLIPSTW